MILNESVIPPASLKNFTNESIIVTEAIYNCKYDSFSAGKRQLLCLKLNKINEIKKNATFMHVKSSFRCTCE